MRRLLILLALSGAGLLACQSERSSDVSPRPAFPPYETNSPLVAQNFIDDLTFAQWKALNIIPPHPASDAIFLRRVYLDVIGTLPTPEEAAAFLKDPSPNKRSTLIDALMLRPEYADYWSMRWSDTLRVKSEFPINLWPNAVQAYYRWIHDAVRENRPWDQWARQLLLSSGSNFRSPEVNFYRAIPSREPAAIAQAVALTFMGARAAEWPKTRLDGLAAFFSQVGYKSTSEWKEEIVYFDFTKPAPTAAVFPDGTPARLKSGQDPRETFTAWLLAPGNPYFARNIANRAWYWLIGRGIVQEPDDIRPDNPPSNPALLARLEQEVTATHYDLRHLFKLILNSQVYQLSSIPQDARPEAAANFAAYPVRRLDAETLIDDVCQITGDPEEYSSPIPEPFTYLNEARTASSVPDGSISSAFLELFGRPPRDTGLASERNNDVTSEQSLHLLNSSHVQLKIQQSVKLRALVQTGTGREPIDKLYLAVLSRYPTDSEVAAASAYFQASKAARWQTTTDLIWALMNSAEFLYRH